MFVLQILIQRDTNQIWQPDNKQMQFVMNTSFYVSLDEWAQISQHLCMCACVWAWVQECICVWGERERDVCMCSCEYMNTWRQVHLHIFVHGGHWPMSMGQCPVPSSTVTLFSETGSQTKSRLTNCLGCLDWKAKGPCLQCWDYGCTPHFLTFMWLLRIEFMYSCFLWKYFINRDIFWSSHNCLNGNNLLSPRVLENKFPQILKQCVEFHTVKQRA